MNLRHLVLAIVITVALGRYATADEIPLSDLSSKIEQGFGSPRVNLSVNGHPLTIAGSTYTTGVGTHAASAWWLHTEGHADRLKAWVGMDDEVKNEPDVSRFGVVFQLVGDGKTLFDSKPMHVGDPARPVDVDLTGVKTLLLSVTPTSDITYCHADWVNATITYTGAKPVAFAPPAESAEILTPKPASTPRINCARVIGVRPGHPLLFTIATTGDRPMIFSASGLPQGITLDAKTGRLTGATAAAGESVVKIKATNAKGSAEGELRIVIGDKIALTPPMGWNSWNCFATEVSDEKVRAAADAMVNSGLINHGWTYINIDDCWEVSSREPAEHRRAPDGHILTNSKFPDMKALADYIHARGLRGALFLARAGYLRAIHRQLSARGR